LLFSRLNQRIKAIHSDACPIKLSRFIPHFTATFISAALQSTGCNYFCEPAAAKGFGVVIVFVKKKQKLRQPLA
jgi:hypothetical protein